MNALAQGETPSSGARESVALVMDLGGNWIRVAVATREGDFLWKSRVPTAAHEGRRAVVARIEEQLQRGISQAAGGGVAGIGLGLASPVDPVTGTMYAPPNIPDLDGVSFKALWEGKVRWPVLVGNDATLAALAEYRYGKGRSAHTLVYITVSTGIGGGIVVQGVPITGAHGLAGEIGHMTLDIHGPRCKCGNVGCLESIASGTAIADRARKRLEGAGTSTIMDIVSGDLDRISAETVFEAARKGDPLAIGILEEAARGLGAGLVNILHLLNPDVIVIGGGVSQNWDYLEPQVRSYIDENAMAHVQARGFKLEASSLGDDNVMLGAAAMVWQEYER